MDTCMTMNFKDSTNPNTFPSTRLAKKMPTKFSSKPFVQRLLVTSISATLLSFSAPVMAEITINETSEPVDNIRQFIADAETKDKQIADQNARQIQQGRQLTTEENKNTQQRDIVDQEDQAVEEEDAELPSESDAEDVAVEAQVQEDIAEQTNDDADSGEAVAVATSRIDDDSIKSIENKNGKVYKTTNLSNYARAVNNAVWKPNMRKNTAMTVKMQALLDWNHASPGPIDGGWGMNSIKALSNFQTMQGLPSTGKMDTATWNALTKNINSSQPVLVEYTLTKDDVKTNFATTPSGSVAKSKMKGLYYQNMKEMLGERFHMDVRYLEKLNKGKRFTEGETITVINVGEPLKARINKVVADKKSKTLYAYNGNKLVATYPTTVGSTNTPSPSGSFKIVNKVKMPWYKSTVKSGAKKEVYMLPPGPNNPVGVVWMGLSKPSYGIHGSPVPEGISRQASAGCVRLTNWDVLEVYANIEKGASVELK